MHDYTGPQDYFNEAYVNEWTSVANSKRPFRSEFFDAFIAELSVLDNPKVLDIGSGPGFLAELVLARCEVASYHLFDFTPHMLEMSRARLAAFRERAVFHQGSFLDAGWWQLLPSPFDAVVSIQTIHEARDGARIPQIYAELKFLLDDGGVVLVADEVNDAENHEEHLLTLKEHEAAFLQSGFENFRRIFAAGDLVMFGAKRGLENGG